MTPEFMEKIVEDLDDIVTVLCVVGHGELDEVEQRALVKGALELITALQRDVHNVKPPEAGAVSKLN